MEYVSGKLVVYRVECPYCGNITMHFAHNLLRQWKCSGCKKRVLLSDAFYDEEVVILIELRLGNEITVSSITEDYS